MWLKHLAVLFLVLLFVTPAYSEEKKDPQSILLESENLFDSDEWKKAADLLERKIKKSDDELSLRCRIRLAEYYDSQKKTVESAKLLEKYSTFSSLESIKLPYRLCLEAFGESSLHLVPQVKSTRG